MSTISSSTTSTTAYKVTADTTGTLVLQTGSTPTTAVTVGSDQSVTMAGRTTNPTTISVGGATPSTSGAGISFPATQSASSDANTLDDYEEGTWTVTDQSGAGLSITVNFAFYTKVGDLVFACCDIVYPATANGSNAAFSLPFTGQRYSNGYVGYSNYTATVITLESVTNSAIMNIQSNTYGAISNATFSGKRLIATFVYKAA